MKRSQNVQVVAPKSAAEILIEQKIREVAKLGTLDLRDNNLGVEGVKALASALKSGACANLTALYFGIKSFRPFSESFAIERSDKHVSNLIMMFHFERDGISKEAAEIFKTASQSKACTKLTELSFKGCKLGSEDVAFLAAALQLKAYPNLTKLNLEDCIIGSTGLTLIVDALQLKACPKLTTIHLANNNLGIEEAGALAKLLSSKSCPNLAVLDLDNNNIGSEGVKMILQGLQKGNHHSLTELNLGRNNIGSEGAKIIFAELQRGGLLELFKLNIEGNRIEDKGAEDLARSLKLGVMKDFTLLDFGGNQFSIEGAKILGSALSPESCPNLTAIDFSSNNPPGGKITASFFAALQPRAYQSIIELYLRSSGLGDDGAKVLATTLAAGTFPNLKKLYLGYNTISVLGIKAIAEALKTGVCSKLSVLDFSCDGIEADGMKAIAEAVQSNACPNLTILHFGCTNLKDEGVKVLASAIKSGACPKLIALDLSSNGMSLDGIKDLASAMKSWACKNLKALNLSSHHFGEEGIKVLLEAMKSGVCPNLVDLPLPQDIYQAYKEIQEINNLINEQRARIAIQKPAEEEQKKLDLKLEKETEVFAAEERLKGDLFCAQVLDLMAKGESGIKKAEEEVLKCLGIHPPINRMSEDKSAVYYNATGDLLFGHKMTQEALKYYKAANNSIKVSKCYKDLLQKEPTNTALLIEKGDYFLSIGRMDKAIGCYNDALGVAVNNKQKAMICTKIIKAPESQKLSMDLYNHKITTEKFYDYSSVTKEDCQEDVEVLGFILNEST